ncbi:MAG: GspH/FimT family pseudopilin [candidate division NC10 bacterium]|nr:GspH/FimT family pseudopilin [candidate division NC10 bacterium]MBI2458905.1 GspH/FimT family pseudopilin [candidate division NC10 bacterium]MBI3085300.1 GspH/FimT family pseudopilin [candidate division NC10 bacterium]
MIGCVRPKNARDQASGRRGATVVELITLVVLLAILVAIAIPNMSPVVLNYRLRGAAWQLAGDIRLARQRAVTLRKRFRVCVSSCAITVPTGAYSVEREDGSFVSETGSAIKLPQDVTVTATATPTFSISGAASGSTFTLTNIMGTYQIKVMSTGEVKVCQGSCS